MAGRHWLDADVFIESSKGLYSLDIAESFWKWLSEQSGAGRICSSTMIYQEIVRREGAQDALARWVKNRRTSGMFIPPDKAVQKKYGEIADHCVEKYSERQAKTGKFLSGGDVWIIAHAFCDGGTVVSNEQRVEKDCPTPKIPNVCSAFEVPCISLTDLLKKLKFKF